MQLNSSGAPTSLWSFEQGSTQGVTTWGRSSIAAATRVANSRGCGDEEEAASRPKGGEGATAEGVWVATHGEVRWARRRRGLARPLLVPNLEKRGGEGRER